MPRLEGVRAVRTLLSQVLYEQDYNGLEGLARFTRCWTTMQTEESPPNCWSGCQRCRRRYEAELHSHWRKVFSNEAA